MPTLRRAALILGIVVILVLVLGILGLKGYLSSSAARDLAAGRLSEIMGLPVEVQNLDVGLGSSSLSFRVVQPAADGRPAAEVLRVESATADVSLTDLATGNVQPTELTVRGLALTLHLDRDGKLLTKLPEPKGGGDAAVPAIKAEGVSLTIKQDGRPDFALTNATLGVTPAGGTVAVKGPVDDPNWGKWDVAAEADTKAGTWKLDLTTAAGPLKMDLLRSIPFVPEETWAHVLPAGATAARVTLTSGADKQVRYDVALTPTGAAEVGLPDLDATVGGVAGTIRIRDAKVELGDCTGTLADGAVRVGGLLDFNPEPSVLTFQVGVERVDVRKLPVEWGLPKKLEGKLRGKAELTLKVPDQGPVVPQGGGVAVVDEAKIGGLPAEVRLRLRGDGKRYRFDGAEPPADTDPKTSRVNPFRGDVVRVGALRRTAARPQQPPPPPAKADDTEPTTLDATVRLRDVDIAELLTKLEVKVPYRLGGKVTVQAKVTIPVAQADNLRTYRVVGTITSPEAKFEDLPVRDFSARIEYANGVLKLTELKGSVPPDATGGSPGSFTGTATAAVEPRGDLSASLDLERLPLGQAVKAVPGGGIDLRGAVTGRAEFRAPLDKLSDAATWVGSADITSDELGVFGRTVRQAAVKLKLDRGTATLTETRGVAEGLAVTVNGTLGLVRPYRFAAAVNTSPLDVADIRKLVAGASLPFAVEGKVDAAAKVTGTLDPLAFTAGGTAKATDLTIGTAGGNRVTLKWDLDQDRVKLTDLSADLFGGTVTGSAEVPLDVTKGGRFAIAFKDVDAGPATRAVPDFPVRLTGRVSGKFAAEVPAAKPGQARQVSADLDLTAPKLTVQGVPAERLTGKVAIADGVAAYTLEGRALGGTFDVKGRYPSRAKGDKPAGPDERGSLRIRGLDLRRLADVFKVESLRLIRGRVDVALTYDDDLSDGFGRVAVAGLGWGNDPVATDLGGTLRVRDGTLTMTDFGGTFAGGQLRGRARVNMADPGRNFFLLTLDRADAKRLFAPAPGLADAAAGQVSVTLRGRLGAETRGSGQLAFGRGTLFGLDATDLRVPFDWAAGTGGSGQLTVRDAVANVGQGRLTGQVTYDWGVTGRLAGHIIFANVRLQGLFGESRLLGNGRITGRFDFGGSNVRSADDVSGTLTGSLNQASVQELPVFRQLTPYLAPYEAVRPYQAGEVRGRLARGVFRLDRLALSNASTQLFAEGNITLAGRLDLDVVANTGRVGIDDRALRLVGLRLPSVGPVPLSLIRDVSDLLSNRTVRLRVTGTVDRPVVQVNVSALLTEEAVRFFLGRVVPTVATGGVAGFILPDIRSEPQPRR